MVPVFCLCMFERVSPPPFKLAQTSLAGCMVGGAHFKKLYYGTNHWPANTFAAAT